MLSLTLFGHFSAALNDEPLSFPTKSVSALVAYLILEQAAPQPRAHISTLLWPDSTDKQGRRNLRQTLLRLRKTAPDTAVGQPLILAAKDTLQWNPAYPAEVDVHQFERHMAEAEPFLHTPLAETPYPAIAPLQAALDLYGDNLLLGFDLLNDFYAEWLQGRRTKYQRQALTGLARLAESYGRVGQPKHMEKMARRQLALAPEREEAHHQLMQAYLAQGEYTAALTQYDQYRRYLQEVGLEPAPALRHLQRLATEQRLGRATLPDPIPHNIPPEETPFYGRQQELDDLLLWLAAPNQRLLTLKGLGGIGKTRLALAAARRLARPWLTIPPRFPGGVWFASLAEVHGDDAESVAETIVQSCGWRTKQDETAVSAAVRYLKHNTHLLILDNLEHLSCMADLILQLLTAVPTLTILTTSRHRLGLQREVVRHLHGLPTPEHERDMDVPSVTLLTERMRRVDDGFRLTTAVAPHLLRICRTLDGWPLALELAASWAEIMDVQEIAARVAGNIASLQTTMPDLPPRHRSMEAALAGSYALLTPEQQRILARFAVLRGGCTLEAAEKILAATARDMALLVRRALLHQHEGRYTVHELVRQFGMTQLAQMADKAAAARAHAAYYLDLLVTLEDDLYGPNPLPAVRRLRPERENIYRAWRWAVKKGRYETLTITLPGLIRFYNMTGLLREGESLLRETRTAVTRPPFAHDLLFAHTNLYLRLGNYEAAHASLATLPPLENLAPIHQMEAHLCWGKLHIFQGDIPESRHHHQHALTLARTLDHQEGVISSLVQLGILHDYDEKYSTEIATMLNSLTDLWSQRAVYSFLGAVSIRHGRYREACAHWQKALTISLELEDWYASASFHNNLGDALRELGEFNEAEQAFQRSIALAQSFHNEATRMHALEGWARLYVLREEYDQAIRLAKEAVALAAAYDRPSLRQAALCCLGHAYAGLSLWTQAEETYARAAVLVPDLPHLALESVVGVAYVRWRQGDETAARVQINRFLHLLAHADIEGFASPTFNYERAAQVLRALGEEQQAEEMLSRARLWLQEQVEQ